MKYKNLELPANEERPYSIGHNFPVRKDSFEKQFQELKSPKRYQGLEKNILLQKKKLIC